jgi:hypothetical protein
MCFHVLDKGEKGNDETRSPVRRQLSLLSQSQRLFQLLTQLNSIYSMSTNVLSWLEASGGTYDRSAWEISEFEGMGKGAVALRDIEVRTSLSDHF